MAIRLRFLPVSTFSSTPAKEDATIGKDTLTYRYRPPDFQNGRMNRLVSPVAFALGLLAYVSSSVAGEPFAGTWAIALHTPAERQRGAECGTAEFVLAQDGDVITGIRSMAVSGCGRLNE